MKLRLIAFLLLLSSILVKAQPISPYLDNDNASVVLKAKSVLYIPEKDLANTISQRIETHQYYDYIVDTSTLKTKKVSNQTEIPVLGLIRSKDSFLFDLYVVLYKDKLYFASPSNIIDNGLLVQKTKTMNSIFYSLIKDVKAKQTKFDDCLKQKEKIIKDTLSSLDMDSEEWQSIIKNYNQSQIKKKEHELQATFDKWYNSTPASARRAASILSIETSYLDEPNSASGCDYILHYTNRSNKTIKYLHWYGNIYNAVNDRVSCDIRRTSNFNGYDTGPVLPNQQGGGVWETVIYRWDAKELRLTKIKIDYTDGSSATISANDIQYIRDVPRQNLSLYEIEKMQEWIPDTISNVFHERRDKFSKRKYFIEKFKADPVKVPLIEGFDDEESNIFFEDLFKARDELIKSRQTLDTFERSNHVK